MEVLSKGHCLKRGLVQFFRKVFGMRMECVVLIRKANKQQLVLVMGNNFIGLCKFGLIEKLSFELPVLTEGKCPAGNIELCWTGQMVVEWFVAS